MSLTSFIKSSKELRDKLRTSLNRPTFGLKQNILAEPQSKNYSVVGQAFDYLLRFWLEHQFPKYISNNEKWVAHHTIGWMIQKYSKDKSVFIYIGRLHDVKVNRTKFLEMVKLNYNRALFYHEEFVKSGKLSDELLESCLFLARLDVTFRAGMIDPNLGNESKEDLQDLRSLFLNISKSDFNPSQRIILNPTFGKGSELVGGADTDVIIDDILIDIKTTKNLELNRDDLNQIIGYYFLSKVEGILGNKKADPINYLAIYFSRFGILYKFHVSELGSDEQLNECYEWFCDHANQFLWNGKSDLVIDWRNVRKGKAKTKKSKPPKKVSKKGQ